MCIHASYAVPSIWTLTYSTYFVILQCHYEFNIHLVGDGFYGKWLNFLLQMVFSCGFCTCRLEASNMENSSLKKKVDKLEHGNRCDIMPSCVNYTNQLQQYYGQAHDITD